MAKIERKLMAHMINATPGGEADTYERLGSDLEEFSAEMNAQIETTNNILGQKSVKISGYEKTAGVEPYYAEKGSKLFEFLQGIIDDDLALDACKTDVVEVKLWETASPENTYPATKEECFIEVVSYGGDTTGYQIPFNIHYTGVKTKGNFDISKKSFAPA